MEAPSDSDFACWHYLFDWNCCSAVRPFQSRDCYNLLLVVDMPTIPGTTPWLLLLPWYLVGLLSSY